MDRPSPRGRRRRRRPFGGVGYDINCGVRLLTTPSRSPKSAPLRELVDRSSAVPSGVGSSRSDFSLAGRELDLLCSPRRRLRRRAGYGGPPRISNAIEAGGCLAGADPNQVSVRARRRGRPISSARSVRATTSSRSDGSTKLYDAEAARALGLERARDGVDPHRLARPRPPGLRRPSRHHAHGGEALRHRAARSAALLRAAAEPGGAGLLGSDERRANFAFANRQLITHFARRAFAGLFGEAVGAGIDLVYDVAHNIAKLEEHDVDGAAAPLRPPQGGDASLPPGHPELAERFRELGQPVLVPGDMGRASFVLLGLDRAASETWSSCCHGAGRRLSRHAAKKLARPRNLPEELAAQGILVRAASRATIDEEMPEAYKDVADVVDVVHGAGLARRLARLRPLAVVKG
jgi:tRNA-splicing ligase RtcB (3'-phosphate/5'-hydroxy nucleic acid ligase)